MAPTQKLGCLAFWTDFSSFWFCSHRCVCVCHRCVWPPKGGVSGRVAGDCDLLQLREPAAVVCVWCVSLHSVICQVC